MTLQSLDASPLTLPCMPPLILIRTVLCKKLINSLAEAIDREYFFEVCPQLLYYPADAQTNEQLTAASCC